MKTLLKNMIRPFYHYIKSKNEREFNRLIDKWGGFGRFIMIQDIKFLNYTFDIPDAPSFLWQFKEIFVDEQYNFETTRKNPIIIDCGSNIGISLLYFSQKYPSAKILGFEADKDIADICIKNLQRNKITNVEVINKAVWTNNGEIEFSPECADGGTIYSTNNLIKVRTIKLREILYNETIIDMLKIDIEGAEYDVLMDCCNSLDIVNNIFIEYHSWSYLEQKLSKILNILEQNKFRYYVEGVGKRKQPFINHKEDLGMDLQLNIFGYKNRELQ